MRHSFVRAQALTCGIAAAGVLFASSAFAHGAPYAVTAGSAPSGTAVAATGSATATVTFRDVTTNMAFTCTVSVLHGSIRAGSSNGSPIAVVNGGTAVFGNAGGQPCTGPAGWKLNVVGHGTWNVDVSDSRNGVTYGNITNIRAHMRLTGATCEFDIGSNTSTTGFASSGSATSTVAAGEQGGTYTNSTQNLVTDPTKSRLGLWNVNPRSVNHNCVANSILKQGDSVTFTGTYHLVADAAAYNPIAIH